MKQNHPPVVSSRHGITMLELTVVIFVLMTLLSVVYLAASAWKRSSDKTSCVLTARQVQQATRSYQNLYGYYFGGTPNPLNGTQDIAAHLYNKGYIKQAVYEQARGTAPCPGSGSYMRESADVFPMPGSLYLECSLAETAEHVPQSHADW